MSVISRSSSAVRSRAGTSFFCATPTTRMPRSLRRRTRSSTCVASSGVSGRTSAPTSTSLHTPSISSTAPLVMSWRLPVPSSTTTLMRRRSKSKGISSARCHWLRAAAIAAASGEMRVPRAPAPVAIGDASSEERLRVASSPAEVVSGACGEELLTVAPAFVSAACVGATPESLRSWASPARASMLGPPAARASARSMIASSMRLRRPVWNRLLR